MKTGEKVIIGTAGAAGTGLLIYGISRLLAKPPPEGEGAEIGIVILGPDGQPVPKNSPVSLLEGESYTAQVTVTNLSTKAEVPWEAILRVVAVGTGVMFYIYPAISREEYFSAGETRVFEYPLNVPLGYGGQSGRVWAVVRDPTGAELARDFVDITIKTEEAPPGEGLIEVHLAWDIPPPFEAGSIRNAMFTFYNPTPQACKYQITKTYFGVYRGVWGANIGSGESMNFAGAITMPSVPGTYYDAIILDIYELETGESCTVTFDVEISS